MQSLKTLSTSKTLLEEKATFIIPGGSYFPPSLGGVWRFVLRPYWNQSARGVCRHSIHMPN